MSEFIDLDIEYEKNSIPLRKLIPKGMTIKEYFSKEQRLLRGENISYVKFDQKIMQINANICIKHLTFTLKSWYNITRE